MWVFCDSFQNLFTKEQGLSSALFDAYLAEFTRLEAAEVCWVGESHHIVWSLESLEAGSPGQNFGIWWSSSRTVVEVVARSCSLVGTDLKLDEAGVYNLTLHHVCDRKDKKMLG